MRQRDIHRRKYAWLDSVNVEKNAIIKIRSGNAGIPTNVGVTNIARIYTFLTGESETESFIDAIKRKFNEGTHKDSRGNFKLTPTEFMDYLKSDPKFSEELYENNLIEYNRLYDASKEFEFITALEGDFL